MKFYSDNPAQIVWDPIRNKKLCQFSLGEFETSDPDLIDLLKQKFRFEIGYEDDTTKTDSLDEDEESEVFQVRKITHDKTKPKPKGRR